MLQARMFAYPDAARYRLGANYPFLPPNASKSPVYCPTQRDGSMNFTSNYGGDPNYVGAKLRPTKFYHAAKELNGVEPRKIQAPPSKTGGQARLDQAQQLLPVSFATEATSKDFEQATALWHVMRKQAGAQERFIDNAAAHIAEVTLVWLRNEVYGTCRLVREISTLILTFASGLFAQVDSQLSERIKKITETKIEGNHAHPHKTAWH